MRRFKSISDDGLDCLTNGGSASVSAVDGLDCLTGRGSVTAAAAMSDACAEDRDTAADALDCLTDGSDHDAAAEASSSAAVGASASAVANNSGRPFMVPTAAAVALAAPLPSAPPQVAAEEVPPAAPPPAGTTEVAPPQAEAPAVALAAPVLAARPAAAAGSERPARGQAPHSTRALRRPRRQRARPRLTAVPELHHTQHPADLQQLGQQLTPAAVAAAAVARQDAAADAALRRAARRAQAQRREAPLLATLTADLQARRAQAGAAYEENQVVALLSVTQPLDTVSPPLDTSSQPPAQQQESVQPTEGAELQQHGASARVPAEHTAKQHPADLEAAGHGVPQRGASSQPHVKQQGSSPAADGGEVHARELAQRKVAQREVAQHKVPQDLQRFSRVTDWLHATEAAEARLSPAASLAPHENAVPLESAVHPDAAAAGTEQGEPVKTGSVKQQEDAAGTEQGEPVHAGSTKEQEDAAEVQRLAMALAVQRHNEQVLLRALKQPLGLDSGWPREAMLVFRCCRHWQLFEAEHTELFDSLLQRPLACMGSTALSGFATNSELCYALSTTATLLLLLQSALEPTAASSSGKHCCGVAAPPALQFRLLLESRVAELFTCLRSNAKQQLRSALAPARSSPAVEAAGEATASGCALVAAPAALALEPAALGSEQDPALKAQTEAAACNCGTAATPAQQAAGPEGTAGEAAGLSCSSSAGCDGSAFDSYLQQQLAATTAAQRSRAAHAGATASQCTSETGSRSAHSRGQGTASQDVHARPNGSSADCRSGGATTSAAARAAIGETATQTPSRLAEPCTWAEVIETLQDLRSVLAASCLPSFFAKRLFMQLFAFMDAELFNALLAGEAGRSVAVTEGMQCGLARVRPLSLLPHFAAGLLIAALLLLWLVANGNALGCCCSSMSIVHAGAAVARCRRHRAAQLLGQARPHTAGPRVLAPARQTAAAPGGAHCGRLPEPHADAAGARDIAVLPAV